MKNYLNFETEIKEIENELDKLKDPFNSEGLSQVNTDKILILEKDLDIKLKKNLFKPKSMANYTCCKT